MHQSMNQPAPNAVTAAVAPPKDIARQSRGMTGLVLELIRLYRGWLIIVFVAMLIETAMSIAACN
jgi:hypothetical protein